MKKERNNHILTLACIGALLFSSCSDWLNINHNPNSAEKVDPGYLFNYVAVTWAGCRSGGDVYTPIAQSIQCQADGGDEFGGWSEGFYRMSPYGIGNTWKHYYAAGGNNLHLAIQAAQQSHPVAHNATAQCKILLAEHLYEATVLWGDIPCSEAWKEEIKYPAFDSQEEVMNHILQLLDEALAEITNDKQGTITDYDIFYGGNMSQWTRLAHSLQFRVAMTMVDKDPTKAKLIGQLIQSGEMIQSANDNFLFPYANIVGNENPKYKMLEKYTNGVNILYFANNNVFKPMQERNDARIPRYFEPGADGVYRGLNTRQPAEVDTHDNLLSSVISKYLFRKDAPEVIFSYQEQLFLEAEAYVRGLGVTIDLVKANQLYKKALLEACRFYEADAKATETFIAQLPDLSTLSPEKALYEIHIQQWIDLMDRPIEEFVQWRRSGANGHEVPTLTVPAEAIAHELIRRWEYSPEELTSNPHAPKISPQIWDKMWFDL